MTTKAKFALIDLGSNSFYMAIFETGDRPRAIKHQKKKIQLRRGLKENGSLSMRSRNAALKCLSEFSTTLKQFDVTELKILGTYTFRKLAHNDVFLKEAQTILEHPITILSGEEEARLIFVGASQHLRPNVPRLFIDIGGGSTELTIGQNNKLSVSTSLEMGCVSVQQQFFKDNQLTKSNINHAIDYAKEILAPIQKTYTLNHWDEVIGSSGTILSIVNIIHPKHRSRTIIYDNLLWLKQRLESLKHTDKVKFHGLRTDRENLLPGGLCILIAIFQCLDVSSITLARGGLREGIIHEHLTT